MASILYHGTHSYFREFREGSEGIFFCESYEMADWYSRVCEDGGAGYVIAAQLDIRNPLVMTWREYLTGITESGINHCIEGNEGLILRGYDGLILTDPEVDDPAMASVTHVAFDPAQVHVLSWDCEAEGLVPPTATPRSGVFETFEDGPCP